jgi:uncharacterized protein (TIGR02466 family)
MDRHQVFATNIFVQDNFVFEETATQMKNYIQRLWQEREPGNNWQTDPDLHTKEEFKIFSDMVLEQSKEIIKILDYDVEDIAITDMWGNVLEKGEAHPPHTHSNNFLSGVYYLHSDKAAGIQFFDPRPSADVIVPRKTKKTHNNSNLLSFASKTNRAVFFPSWLNHWVPQNISNNKRISIAWNVQLKGQVGEHHEYQSANF